jgi:thiol-disulfide isomerase/thioredoxin
VAGPVTLKDATIDHETIVPTETKGLAIPSSDRFGPASLVSYVLGSPATVETDSASSGFQRRSSSMERHGKDRRTFLGAAAMAMASAYSGRFSSAGVHASTIGELRALGRATDWLNSPPLTPASLQGKVILIDFWTYSCINWRRALPYVRAWAQKYRQQGLVVIGVHTPEFAFEQDVDNVRWAVTEMRIEHPVVLDNAYAIWRAFRNEYWPALYFIDGQGRIRHRQFGEGEYQQSEKVIQRLLTDAGVAGVGHDLVSVDARGVEAEADWGSLRSPETYVGEERSERRELPDGALPDARRVHAAPTRPGLNHWALSGEWSTRTQSTLLKKAGGRIAYRFHARDLHLVMGPAKRGASVRFRVLIDGAAPGAAHGVDVDELGTGVVVEQRLYQLVRQPRPIVDRRFDIEFLDAGVEAFAFTFG